jgi:hypothetical protein
MGVKHMEEEEKPKKEKKGFKPIFSEEDVDEFIKFFGFDE